MAERAAVVGAGQMGNGIAHTFAIAGFPVTMIDVSAEAVERGLQTIARNLERQAKKGTVPTAAVEQALARIATATDLESASDANVVVEAALEDPQLKFKLFRDLDRVAPTALLASNTSSISITEIAAHTRHPERVIGMHFMNPVPMMALVEVIRGASDIRRDRGRRDFAREATRQDSCRSKRLARIHLRTACSCQ